MKVTALGGQVPEQSKFIDVVPPRVKLVRVVDSGDPYDPPTEAPVEAAKLTIEYLKKMLAEAEQLPD